MYLPDLLSPILGLSALLSDPLPSITGNASELSHVLSERSTWTHLGCYTDQSSPRVLSTSSNPSGLTPTSCQAIRAGAGYTYAGVEDGQECWCGRSATLTHGTSSGCTMACNGNSALTCGGNWAIDLYELSSAASGWTAEGCVVDGTARVLTGASTTQSALTVESYQAFCKGYTYVGVEVRPPGLSLELQRYN